MHERDYRERQKKITLHFHCKSKMVQFLNKYDDIHNKTPKV